MSSFIDDDQERFPPFAVTVDVVALTRRNDELMVVLVRRANEPFAGKWALPGGFVEIEEGLAAAAARELAEETGIEVRIEERDLFGVYGRPGRDPRMRVVSIAFRVLIDELDGAVAGSDAAEVRMWEVAKAVDDPELLAFDHHEILTHAVSGAELGETR